MSDKFFSISNAHFEDADGNRIDIGPASVVEFPAVGGNHTFTFPPEQLPSISFTFRVDDILLIVDPREWVRRNWWKLPVLWERE